MKNHKLSSIGCIVGGMLTWTSYIMMNAWEITGDTFYVRSAIGCLIFGLIILFMIPMVFILETEDAAKAEMRRGF